MEFKRYRELPQDSVYIRETVFVKEQGFREEFDTVDDEAVHIVAYKNDKPVATCRYFFDEEKQKYKLGRMAVLKEERKNGVGRIIMEEAHRQLKEDGVKEIWLSAQERAKGFYEKVGYKCVGDMYLEENYPHYLMYKEL